MSPAEATWSGKYNPWKRHPWLTNLISPFGFGMTWGDLGWLGMTSPPSFLNSHPKQETSGNYFLARYARSMCCLKIAKCSAFWRFNMFNDWPKRCLRIWWSYQPCNSPLVSPLGRWQAGPAALRNGSTWAKWCLWGWYREPPKLLFLIGNLM